MLIDLLAVEYRSLFPDRKKATTDFDDEIIALCSPLDKRGIYAPGTTLFRPFRPEPEELEAVDLDELGIVP